MKNALFFLLRFGVTFLLLSFLYSSVFIHKYDTAEPAVTDPFTQVITKQVAEICHWFGYDATIYENDHLNYSMDDEQTMDSIYIDGQYAVSIEEGCNAISNMIIFIAFIIGFGGKWKKMLWFIPMGLIIIHLANLFRLVFLTIIKVNYGGNSFHFFHKYLFTAIIYGVVFLLWVWWVNKYGIIKKPKVQHA